MTGSQRSDALRMVLVATGLIFIFGIVLLMRLWPSGFQWSPSQPEYEQMIQGVYITLGVFLLLAARSPREHRSLILFTGWSSLVHAGIMGVQAVRDVAERGHLIGDVPALTIIGVALLVLAPRAEPSSEPARASADRGAGRVEETVG
jgi:hypothetical protein